MRSFKVRTFLTNTRDKWPCEDLERFICVFEDGVELEVTTPRMEVSRVLWAVHEEFPKVKITSKQYVGNGPVPWSSIEGVLSNIYREMHTRYDERDFNREYVWWLLYKTAERAFNEYTTEHKSYARSVNAFDLATLYYRPELVEIRAGLRPSPISIEIAYGKARKFLMEEPSILRNPIVSEVRCGLIKMEQLLQILICRGYNTDIDDHIFPIPILGNYFEGIKNPAEAAVDAPLASKALIYQGAPLESTEYANRKLQFSSMYVDLLITGDCGSQKYAKIQVTKKRSRGLLGMNYVHPSTGKLTPFSEADGETFLEQTLSFRAPILCGHRHLGNVCTTCYGELSKNIPYGANIGFIASTNTISKVSQGVLKVKHVESLTVHEPLKLAEGEKAFIRTGKDPVDVFLNPRLAKEGIKLMIRSEAKDKIINGSRLPVLTLAELNPQQSPARHSQFREMLFEVTREGRRPERYKVSVSKGSMSSFLTNDFLRWFVTKDFRIDPDGFYRVDLADWDFDKPFLELPRKHMSMKDFASEVEVMIRSTQEDSQRHLGKLKQLAQYTDPTLAMVDLYDLICSRVSVHMAHVSVVCLSMMVDAEDRFNCRIPPLDRPIRFAKYSRKISQGSLSVMAAYQGSQAELMKLSQYQLVDRPQHILDPIYVPVCNEV